MKSITQHEFDALPIIDGRRQCPGETDYRQISSFGAGCSFGEGCSFGDGCSFGARCGFGAECRFGEGCRLEDKKPLIGSTVYTFGGFGRENRTTYMIPTKSGIFVRCGCWSGTLMDFRKRVAEVHGDNEIAREYLAICDVAEMRWKRSLAALGAGEEE